MTALNFVIVPKYTDNEFFVTVGVGCAERAKDFDHVECYFIGPETVDAKDQARIIKELVTDPKKYNLTRAPDGISVAVIDEVITGEAIDFLSDEGVPVVTFDADAPKSKRLSFVGTNNFGFGVLLGKILDQINPNGTYYGLITAPGSNLEQRVEGVRERLEDQDLTYFPTKWKEADYSPLDCENNNTLAMEHMYSYASDPNIRAIISVGGWVTTNPEAWKEFEDSHRNITTVVADSEDHQIQLMQEGYIDGLGGQLPYKMGEISLETLYNYCIIQNEKKIPEQVTNMLEVVLVPLDLSPAQVTNNAIGNLAIYGYVLFAIVTLSSITVGGWVFWNRKTRVVKSSQPPFLFMVCAGTLIMGLGIIPMSIDDYSTFGNPDVACMATPWFTYIGFTTIFSGLFSKTIRIYKLMKAAKKFKRIKLDVKDVLLPYIALMVCDIVILSTWTALAPLKYVRTASGGTDSWNRVIATTGYCQSASGKRTDAIFQILLLLINGIALVLANIAAYLARNMESEFSESRYIGIIIFGILLTSMIGIPIVVLLNEEPIPFFFTRASLIFLYCMSTLVVLFVPKVIAMRQKKSENTTKNVNTPKNEVSDAIRSNLSTAPAPAPAPIKHEHMPTKNGPAPIQEDEDDGLNSSLSSNGLQWHDLMRMAKDFTSTKSDAKKKAFRDFMLNVGKLSNADRQKFFSAMENL